MMKLIRSVRSRVRLATSSYRALPDFLIIGAQKAGTSSLFKLLIQHPLITRSYRKELQYFTNHFALGLPWYRSQFPLKVELGQKRITGEATPYYLFHPLAPERAWQTVPEAKLIVLLRDPVTRAISHYFHAVRHGYESLSIEDALVAESERLVNSDASIKEGGASEAHQHFSYQARGIYVDQLERWFEYYDPSRTLVVKSEDFFADPSAVTQQAQEFLGLPAKAPSDVSPKNKGVYRSRVAPAVMERLARFYRPHNQRLYELLGRDMEWQ
jgi:hypothetical protein